MTFSLEEKLKKKVEVFSSFVFIKNRSKKKLFAHVLDKKEAIKDYKNDCLQKKSKITIFSKGLVHRFSQKFEIFLTLRFMQNRPRKSIWERPS